MKIKKKHQQNQKKKNKKEAQMETEIKRKINNKVAFRATFIIQSDNYYPARNLSFIKL